jgi:uncharacterized protein (DUF983 family)
MSKMLVRALAKRCPWCGSNQVFKHWLRVRDKCPRCGLRFDREEGAWLMSITINYGVTAFGWIVLFVVALVLWLPHVNVAGLVIASLVEIVVVAVVTYPVSKTLTAAADLLVHNAHKDLAPEMEKRFGITTPSVGLAESADRERHSGEHDDAGNE